MSAHTARPNRGSQLVAVLLVALASVASLAAQGHDAPLERGFAADRVFALGDIDHVEIGSGNVVVTLPLGITYPVNGGFSYSMKLIYNSSVWDFKESETAVCYDGEIAYYCPMLKAIPARQSNAGMGWSLSLGQLLDENDPENPNIGGYTYVAPDGTMSTYATCPANSDCGNRYPKDGQRLRFRYPAMGDDDRLSVDHPDGTVSTFECHEGDDEECSTTDRKWWLKSISDQHGNWVKVSYDTWNWPVPGTSTTISCPLWTITDNAGGTTAARSHHVYFRPNVTDPESPFFSYHVEKVVLSAFGGTGATYQFAYTFPRVHRSYNDIDNSSCDWLNDGVGCDPPEDRVPFLSSVSLPDGSSFSMPDYYLDAPTFQDGPNTPGILKKLVLPTGGAIGWEHQRWDYVATEIEPPSCQDDSGTPPNECVHHLSNRWSGIKNRSLYESASATSPFATWTYSTATTDDMFPGQDDHIDRERRVVVVDPNSNASVYYFRAAPQWLFTEFETWDYALPFTTRLAIDVADDPTTSPVRYLSEEHFQGGVTFNADGQSSGTVKRSKYVRYEPEGAAAIGTEYRSINRRLVSQTTVFHEDPSTYSATVDYSDFDGLGNVRTTKEQAGAFGGTDWSRETFTGYNPTPLGSGYPTYALGRAPESGEVRWGLDQPWVISTFDAHKTTLTEIVSGSPVVTKASTEQCVPKNASGFPTSGFVTRRRVLKADTDRGAADLVTVLDEDGDSRGNVAAEKYYGGDTQIVSTTGHVCSITLPSSPKYRIDHTYSYGALETSRYNGQSWYLVDNAVDQATGLVATSHAASTRVGTTYDAGISTYFTYDAMGRLLTQAPESGHDARIRHEYFRFDPDNRPDDPAPRVESCSFPNNLWASTCTSSIAVSRSSVRFDGHGRPAIEKTRLPATGCPSPPCWQWNQRLTEYTPMGWKASVSEWQPNGTSGDAIRRTLFGYDPFGRVTSLTPPDGSDHAVTTAYVGAHQVARTVKVFTGTSEVSSTTTELYDRLGQLVSVTEPSNAGSDFSTTYRYDVGGRLKEVKSTLGSNPQTRTFTYDRRGFLSQETLPEKGSSGNATVTYWSYDARGHLLKKYDGGYSTFAYDGAERLIAACDTSATCTTTSSALLKAMTYAATNVAATPTTPANWRAGKLETAKAVNRAFTLPVGGGSSGTTTVTETYTYAGRGGRASTRATAVALTGAPSGNFSQSFTQSFTWTELGQLDALAYPTCVAAACTNTMRRSVFNAYQGGRLVAVRPYYASEITYHPNGMLKQVRHTARAIDTADGVAERVDADPNAMGRPYRIYTDGATLRGATSGVEGDWSNGFYSYDGAGNIKKLLRVSGSTTDTLKPDDDTFTYDAVSRLTAAEIATAEDTYVTQEYAYDAWGNLTSYAGQPRAVDPPTSNHLDDASYDAAGNQTGWLWDTGLSRYTYIYGYDRLNQMRYVNGPDGQHRVLAYTADGERIVERDLTGGITTFNLRGLDGALLREVELKNGAYKWLKDYVYRDGQLLASQHHKEGHQHYHLDHLGTTRMLTNRCGERVKRYEQFPYGDTISAPDDDTETRRFTGHQRDIGSPTNTADDLEYMHARYYGMKMGRLLSVDPGGGAARAPQQWNRYAYVSGNPMRRVDPDGAEEAEVAIPIWQRETIRDYYNQAEPGLGDALAEQHDRSMRAGQAGGLAVLAAAAAVVFAPEIYTWFLTPRGQQTVVNTIEALNPNPGSLNPMPAPSLASISEAVKPVGVKLGTELRSAGNFGFVGTAEKALADFTKIVGSAGSVSVKDGIRTVQIAGVGSVTFRLHSATPGVVATIQFRIRGLGVKTWKYFQDLEMLEKAK